MGEIYGIWWGSGCQEFWPHYVAKEKSIVRLELEVIGGVTRIMLMDGNKQVACSVIQNLHITRTPEIMWRKEDPEPS